MAILPHGKCMPVTSPMAGGFSCPSIVVPARRGLPDVVSALASDD